MLCLGGFDLYPRWVPLNFLLTCVQTSVITKKAFEKNERSKTETTSGQRSYKIHLKTEAQAFV